jgi:hypothetical protein
MQAIRSHYAAATPVPAARMRSAILRAVTDTSPTLVVMDISDEEAARWDAYARTRPGFQTIGG